MTEGRPSARDRARYETLARVATEAAVAVGEAIAVGDTAIVTRKRGRANFATAADHAAEKAIIERLRAHDPAVPVLSEESARRELAKAEHVFSAAHFITFEAGCERLHGHNYRVAAEVYGPLDENHLVIDFLLMRAKLREITAALDHYVLLPTRHPQICVVDDGREVTATFAERRWVFSRGDCQLLVVANRCARAARRGPGQRAWITARRFVGGD